MFFKINSFSLCRDKQIDFYTLYLYENPDISITPAEPVNDRMEKPLIKKTIKYQLLKCPENETA